MWAGFLIFACVNEKSIMELRQLKYFVKSAEYLNFSEAAKHLFITQSTLSQQIKQVECELGFTLFLRNSRHISLTEAGEEFRDFDMILQRRLLLSFTATAGFEQYISDDTLVGIAQKSFLDTLNKHNTELYKTSSDTGAFSFYYLAFRRGSEVERRIGQTFAMLCLHDGDPIFQELGEALYCWFSSVVRKAVSEYLN